MADRPALPTDDERRAYIRKLKTFRAELSPREQRMLDAIVFASYYPGGNQSEVEGYRLLPLDTIYDDQGAQPPLDNSPWGKVLGNI